MFKSSEKRFFYSQNCEITRIVEKRYYVIRMFTKCSSIQFYDIRVKKIDIYSKIQLVRRFVAFYLLKFKFAPLSSDGCDK